MRLASRRSVKLNWTNLCVELRCLNLASSLCWSFRANGKATRCVCVCTRDVRCESGARTFSEVDAHCWLTSQGVRVYRLVWTAHSMRAFTSPFIRSSGSFSKSHTVVLPGEQELRLKKSPIWLYDSTCCVIPITFWSKDWNRSVVSAGSLLAVFQIDHAYDTWCVDIGNAYAY